MLISAAITEKHMGSKLLFRDLSFSVPEGAKIGLIGRNGIGKSTLFGLLSGEDTDYVGTMERKRGIRVIATAQEHAAVANLNPLEYVLHSVPRYQELKQIVATYPDTMGSDLDKIHVYTEALQEFTEAGYYTVEDEIVEALGRFSIDMEAALRPLGKLSGGQKRFMELVKVTFAKPDLILLDEPTNHLDYHGKALFLEWLKDVRTAVCVISHDRDVLKHVKTVIEIRDYRAFTFPGNYDAYIAQNGTATVTQIGQYESTLKRLETLHKQIQTARARKGSASDARPKILEERLQREYDALKATVEKPSFWIDRDTTAELGRGMAERYQRYKARTIRIGATASDRHAHKLLDVEELSVGYADKRLFSGVSFALSHGDRLEIHGRNGAGKSTLIKAVLGAVAGASFTGTIFHGSITGSGKLRVGVYEQEIDPRFLSLTLGKAVEQLYAEYGKPLTNQEINALLADYLFDPIQDRELRLSQLSGGQKARFQLMRMLCASPNLLILDEPTNHLDLPSIEELEAALETYRGAIIYVSHDSYFSQRMGGAVLQIGKA